MRPALHWMSVVAIVLGTVVSLAGLVACVQVVAEHDMRIGKWYIHYVFWAVPGTTCGGAALLALACLAPSRRFRLALSLLAVLGLAPATVGIAWALLR